MRYKTPLILQAVVALIPNLAFHTEDPDDFRYTVKIFLSPNLPLSENSEAAMVARQWDTALDIRTLTTYSDIAYLLHIHKVAPIVGWEAAKRML